MAGQIHFSERCVCGATINLAENYSFINHQKLAATFAAWQQRHAQCLPLFHDIQKLRAAKLLQLEAGR